MTELLDAYLRAHHTAPDPVLDELARETARRFPAEAQMQVSADEGALLGLLAGLTGARFAVELGVFTGYSALCIARALPPGGRLLACDVSAPYTALALEYWRRAGVAERIDLRLAPALETLSRLPEEPSVDFAFIDADKGGYPAYYEALVRRLRPGGLLVLDNVLLGGKVLDPATPNPAHRGVRALNAAIVRDERVDAVMLPVRDGVTLVRRRV